MFSTGAIVNNNTYNISGGVQGGVVSVGGGAKNDGTVNVHYNTETVAAIQEELSKAERELYRLHADESLKKQALREVQAAKADPSPGKVEAALKALKKMEAAVSNVVGIGTHIGTVTNAIGRLAGLI